MSRSSMLVRSSTDALYKLIGPNCSSLTGSGVETVDIPGPIDAQAILTAEGGEAPLRAREIESDLGVVLNAPKDPFPRHACILIVVIASIDQAGQV